MYKYFMFHGDICWKDENDHFHPVTYVEILKILNENEERKNQNKKYELLAEMVQDIYNKSNSEPQDAMEPLIQLMDRFYNLEADDGK